MKNKVYIFGIGDTKRVEPIVKALNTQGLDVEVGPSADDDKILCSEYKYYSDAKKNKIYAFMSDVGRVYKLSENRGIYVDVSVQIGEEFYKLFENIDKYEVGLPRCKGNETAFSLMGSNGKNSFFHEVLKLYKKYNAGHPSLYFIGPHICDYILYKNGCFAERNDNQFVCNGIFIDTAKPTFDKKYVLKFGDGSGKTTKHAVEKPGKPHKSYAQICAENGGTLPSGRLYNPKLDLPLGDIERINECTKSNDKRLNKFAKVAYKKFIKQYGFPKFKNLKVGFVIFRVFRRCFKNKQ